MALPEGKDMTSYIWQRQRWWNFTWDSAQLLPKLSQARKAQGYLIAKADMLALKSEADLYVEEAFQTSAIEGEAMQRDDIRSSVASRLGLLEDVQRQIHRNSDGLVSLLIDATRNYVQPLTEERLHNWHAGLFPTGRSGIRPITVAAYRQSKKAMEVISGPMGREKVHYLAPSSIQLNQEMARFID